MKSFLLGSLFFLVFGLFTGSHPVAAAIGPQNPVSSGVNQTQPSSLPTRLMVRTRARGWFGLLGAPAPDTIQQRIENGTGMAIFQVEKKAEYLLFTFERRLDPIELRDALTTLSGMDGVAEVYEDVVLEALHTPNDPGFDFQLVYYGAVKGGMNLQAAWDLTTGSSDTVIAVLDTGKISHPELDSRWLAGYDFLPVSLSNDGDGRDADPTDPGDRDPAVPTSQNSWHGAHVSGSIGAAGDNGVGIAGVNFQAWILPVRVLGKGGGYMSDIADGLRWAAGLPVSGAPTNPNPAQIANLSLGGSGSCYSYFQNAINEAVGAGTVVVVAAGNSASDIQGYTPAGCQNVIVVGANDNSDWANLSWFSNYGAITLTAPGQSILSTINDGQYAVGSPAYAYKSGTSMATPHVVGAVSLMLAVNPGLTQADIIQILQQTARPWPVDNVWCGQLSLCGAGILDTEAAVRMAQSYGQPSPTATSIAAETSTPAWTPTPVWTATSVPTAAWTPTPTLTPAPITPGPTPTDGERIIEQIAPQMDTPDWDTRLTIYGAHFDDQVAVRVGQSTFAGERLTLLDSTRLEVSIPANTLPVGTYSVEVCWVGGSCSQAPQPYKVVDDLYEVFLPATLN